HAARACAGTVGVRSAPADRGGAPGGGVAPVDAASHRSTAPYLPCQAPAGRRRRWPARKAVDKEDKDGKEEPMKERAWEGLTEAALQVLVEVVRGGPAESVSELHTRAGLKKMDTTYRVLGLLEEAGLVERAKVARYYSRVHLSAEAIDMLHLH